MLSLKTIPFTKRKKKHVGNKLWGKTMISKYEMWM